MKRSHLTTRKDIANIERAFGLRRAERHKDDAISVGVWVQDMMKSESNPVLLYQCSPQGFSAERAALPFTFRAFNNYAHDVGGHVT